MSNDSPHKEFILLMLSFLFTRCHRFHHKDRSIWRFGGQFLSAGLQAAQVVYIGEYTL